MFYQEVGQRCLHMMIFAFTNCLLIFRFRLPETLFTFQLKLPVFTLLFHLAPNSAKLAFSFLQCFTVPCQKISHTFAHEIQFCSVGSVLGYIHQPPAEIPIPITRNITHTPTEAASMHAAMPPSTQQRNHDSVVCVVLPKVVTNRK